MSENLEFGPLESKYKERLVYENLLLHEIMAVMECCAHGIDPEVRMEGLICILTPSLYEEIKDELIKVVCDIDRDLSNINEKKENGHKNKAFILPQLKVNRPLHISETRKKILCSHKQLKIIIRTLEKNGLLLKREGAGIDRGGY